MSIFIFITNKELNTRATFSGRQDSQSFNINLSSSTNISTSKQANYLNRYLHSSAIYEDFLFIFGGLNSSTTASPTSVTSSNLLSDLSCFHFATRTWTTIETESDVSTTLCLPRFDHSAVVYGDSMFIFGGATVLGSSDSSSAPAASSPLSVLDDLLEFKFETGAWSSITGEGTRPSKRRGHSCVIYENSMFIFGGLSHDDKPLNDVYEFSFNNLRWNKIAINGHVMPKPRYHHSAVVFKDSMFIFGGTDGSTVSSDFLEFKISLLLSSSYLIS